MKTYEMLLQEIKDLKKSRQFYIKSLVKLRKQLDK